MKQYCERHLRILHLEEGVGGKEGEVIRPRGVIR